MKFIVTIALLFVLAVVVLMLLRSAGPRIMTIEHRRDEREDEEDQE